MTFNDCCKAVIAAAKSAKPSAMIGYAASYAQVGLNMSDAEMIRVQALYIRANLGNWRGEEARKVKAELDRIGKR